MLAIIKALDEWDAELWSVKAFTIITDHHNLEYFMSTQKLTEQQMRWANTLSKYDFKIAYTPGKSNTIPDVLSHKPQDIPDGQDERVLAWECQLLKLGMCAPGVFNAHPVLVVPANAEEDNNNETPPIESLWTEWHEKDTTLQQIQQAINKGKRKFPPDLKLKVSIGECEVQNN